jgi:uncharacterized protein YbjQ (UPF0145 family)
MAADAGDLPKKDMTSLFDLAQKEPPPEPVHGLSVEMPPIEKVTEADFAAMESLPEGQQEPPSEQERAPQDVIGQDSPMTGLPGLQEQIPQEASPQDSGLAGLSSEQERAPEEASPQDSGLAGLAGLSSEQERAPEEASPQDSGLAGLSSEHQSSESAYPGDSPPLAESPDSSPVAKSVTAPPPRAKTAVPLPTEPGGSAKSFSAVKDFGEKIAIAHPRIDASPPFSFMAKIPATEKNISRVRDVLTKDDYGVHFRDVEVQLKSGKLFVPKISEYAAIHLAMQLREICDDILIDLSSAVFKAKSGDAAESDFDNVLFDAEVFHTHTEDVRDLGSEPKSEKDLFSTHLEHLEGYKVTRVLSVLNVSKIVGADVAEDKTGRRLEDETDSLVQELINRAFKLGAHGVIGMSFTLKSFDIHTPLGKKRGLRLWGTGTAVRAHKLSN